MVRYIQPILDLSLFWKMGMVIGACVLVSFIMAGILYFELQKLYTGFEFSPGYKYELLAQEGLRLLERMEKSPENSEEYLRNLLELRTLLKAGMAGGIYHGRLASLPGEFTLRFPNPETLPPEPRSYLKASLEALEALEKGKAPSENLAKLRASLEKTLIWGHDNCQRFRQQMSILVSRTTTFKWIMLVFVGVFLLWGAVAFIFMVLQPLRQVTERIRDMARGKGLEECIDGETGCVLEYYARDEIGQLVDSVNELVSNYQDLNLFKHVIEEDEEVEEVFKRLGEAFQKKLGLENFVLLQVSNSQNTMEIVCTSPPGLEVNPEILFNASFCRAKRTGHVVSSLDHKGICPRFLWPEEADHYCIPMMSGGECIGVVQFLLPPEYAVRKEKNLHEKLRMANRYIEEAVPVIEAKRYAASFKEQSLKDPLTELYNRRFLETAIESLVAGVMRRKTTLGILMADLDYFKEVNDKYGHDAGDLILKETAQIFKKNVRNSDLVVRFGGEEFLILLMDTRNGESVKVAEKLRRAVEAHEFHIRGNILHKTVSIGVSEFPTDAQGIWEAIKYADVALYKAKEMGRNRVVRFTPDMWPAEEY
ncbi:GGDEF domain-containing protein [Thermosulfurimonas marina]|uniref:diguanylate cyclase n=1 Tax=Thermosulfurimonas marina TaxID=2047767 RepID=A0A6H1WS70_9BACT|nr:GGDEF domain-containing protein [Thermosulfurimonas marina]QJA06065.1 GGDEF domain-containing protein [Thermosulfurimonas marina]